MPRNVFVAAVSFVVLLVPPAMAQTPAVEPLPVPAAPAPAASSTAAPAAPASPPPAPASPASPASPPPAPAAKPIREGAVLDVRERDVVIDLGQDDGLEVGRSVELFERARVDLGLGEMADTERGNVVGRVTLASKARASVRLGMHERAAVGYRARAASVSPSANRSFPPRFPAHFEVEGTAKGFLGKDFGFLFEGGASYRFDVPLRLRARFDPVIVTRDFTGVVPQGLVGYDGRLVEIAVGAGWASKRLYQDGDVLILPVHLRVGAVDGVMAELTNTFSAKEKIVEFASVRLAGYAPIAENLWFTSRLVVSDPLTSFDAGLRFLTLGSGGAGSLFLAPNIGYVVARLRTNPAPSPNGLTYGLGSPRSEVGGFMLGLGTEIRL
jgi:hypothetical protein